jgi:hypothetical protein
VANFTPRPLKPQGKSPWYPLDRRLCGNQSRSGRGGEEKNSQLVPGLEPSIIQPIASAIPLNYPASCSVVEGASILSIRVVIEKLIVAQLIKKSRHFNGIRMSVTAIMRISDCT